MNTSKNRIEQTLSSLENIKKAEMSPFVYARIESRLHSSEAISVNISLVWSMAACVLIVLSINVFTLLHYAKMNSDINSNVLTNEYFSYTKNIPVI